MKPVTTSISPSGHRISPPSQTRDFSAPRKLVAARTSDEYAPVPTRFKPAILPQSGNSPSMTLGRLLVSPDLRAVCARSVGAGAWPAALLGGGGFIQG